MLLALRHYAARHRLLSPGDRIGIAVSGGADSLCLFRLLLALRDDIGLALSVLHFNHRLRPEAAADADFVRELAQQFDCRFFLGAGDVRARAASASESIETAARHLRYEFFTDLLLHGAIDKVATAHTRDDQAETVLMKLLRGAGTRGLSAIHPLQPRNTGSIIRPLLFAARAEVESYLRDIAQPWRTDLSNADLAHTRNRVRHQLLPALRAFNPEAETALAHTAEIMRAEEEYWRIEVERALPFILLPGSPVRDGGRATTSTASDLALSIEALLPYPLALQRHLVRAALTTLGVAPTLEETDRLLTLAGTLPATTEIKPGKWIDLNSGVRVRRLHRELQFSAAGEPASKALLADETFTFTGEPLFVPFGDLTLHLSLSSVKTQLLESPSLTLCLPLSLTLRPWRPGDRFHPPHTRALKKVKELLQARRLAPEVRSQWPVLAHSSEILWLRGFPPRSIIITAPDGTLLGTLLIGTL